MASRTTRNIRRRIIEEDENDEQNVDKVVAEDEDVAEDKSKETAEGKDVAEKDEDEDDKQNVAKDDDDDEEEEQKTKQSLEHDGGILAALLGPSNNSKYHDHKGGQMDKGSNKKVKPFMQRNKTASASASATPTKKNKKMTSLPDYIGEEAPMDAKDVSVLTAVSFETPIRRSKNSRKQARANTTRSHKQNNDRDSRESISSNSSEEADASVASDSSTKPGSIQSLNCTRKKQHDDYASFRVRNSIKKTLPHSSCNHGEGSDEDDSSTASAEQEYDSHNDNDNSDNFSSEQEFVDDEDDENEESSEKDDATLHGDDSFFTDHSEEEEDEELEIDDDMESEEPEWVRRRLCKESTDVIESKSSFSIEDNDEDDDNAKRLEAGRASYFPTTAPPAETSSMRSDNSSFSNKNDSGNDPAPCGNDSSDDAGTEEYDHIVSSHSNVNTDDSSCFDSENKMATKEDAIVESDSANSTIIVENTAFSDTNSKQAPSTATEVEQRSDVDGRNEAAFDLGTSEEEKLVLSPNSKAMDSSNSPNTLETIDSERNRVEQKINFKIGDLASQLQGKESEDRLENNKDHQDKTASLSSTNEITKNNDCNTNTLLSLSLRKDISSGSMNALKKSIEMISTPRRPLTDENNHGSTTPESTLDTRKRNSSSCDPDNTWDDDQFLPNHDCSILPSPGLAMSFDEWNLMEPDQKIVFSSPITKIPPNTSGNNTSTVLHQNYDQRENCCGSTNSSEVPRKNQNSENMPISLQQESDLIEPPTSAPPIKNREKREGPMQAQGETCAGGSISNHADIDQVPLHQDRVSESFSENSDDETEVEDEDDLTDDDEISLLSSNAAGDYNGGANSGLDKSVLSLGSGAVAVAILDDNEDEVDSSWDSNVLVAEIVSDEESSQSDIGAVEKKDKDGGDSDENNQSAQHQPFNTQAQAKNDIKTGIQSISVLPMETREFTLSKNLPLSAGGNMLKDITNEFIAGQASGKNSDNGTNDNDKSKKSIKRRSAKPGKWTLGSRIGKGSFGSVYTCMAQDGTLLAVKIVHAEKAVMKDIRREIDLLKKCCHPNIVAYRGSEVKNSNLYIFQEWVPGGSVTSLLSRFGPFSLSVTRAYLAQVLAGLAYLHDHQVLHRDIKGASLKDLHRIELQASAAVFYSLVCSSYLFTTGSNILVNDLGIVKLADFGASKIVSQIKNGMMMTMTLRGTPYFMAQEVFEERYGFESDIWSVGCVAIQMVTGTPPWKNLGINNPVLLYNHIKSHEGPPTFQFAHSNAVAVEENFMAMLTRCFQKIPKNRPTAGEMMDEPFFLQRDYSIDETAGASITSSLLSPCKDSSYAWENLHSPATPHSHSASKINRGGPRRSISAGCLKAAFLSPPVPEHAVLSRTYANFQKTPMMSPKMDSSEWPTWAKNGLDATVSTSNGRTSKTLPSPAQAQKFHLAGDDMHKTLDSLAISDESCSETLDFERKKLFCQNGEVAPAVCSVVDGGMVRMSGYFSEASEITEATSSLCGEKLLETLQ